jgi:polar amino acid transport system substrate-binding protein
MRLVSLSVILFIMVLGCGGALAQSAASSEIAPAGKLRVGIQTASQILATRERDGSFSGISVDLGKFIAERLGVSFEAVLYANEPAYVQSFGKDECDIAILGRDALHANNDVTPDFMLADALYIAAPGREFVDAGQIDRPGVKVGVVRGGIAEKRLGQVLKSAELVRVSPGVNSAIETLRSDKADVWASNPGSHAGDPRWAARGEDRARGVCDGSVCGGTPERTIV